MTSSKLSPGTRLAGRLLFALLAVAAFLSGPSANANASLERGLGRQVAQQLEEEIGLVRDPALAGWVARLGTRIVRANGGDPLDYSFKILDADDVNAFAVPGGYIYVTMGLLRFVESEDELAAVIGHEIAHIASHHGMRQLKRDLLLTLALSMLRGHVPEVVSTLGQVGGVLYSLRHSRSDEAAADALGAQKVARAGYDPTALVEFLRKLNEKEKRRPSRFEVYFLTHPPTAERLEKARGFPEVDRANLLVRRAVADGLAERGLYRQAVRVYEEMLEQQTDDASLRLAAARCWERLGYEERAAIERERARALGAAADENVRGNRPAPAGSRPAPRSAIIQASASVVRAHEAMSGGRDERVRLVGDTRRSLDGSKRRFRSLLGSLNTAAGSLSPNDVVRQEMLYRIGLAVGGLEKAISRVEGVAESGMTIPDQLAVAAEALNDHLGGASAGLPLLAIAEGFEPEAARALGELDRGLKGCREALIQVDGATRLCQVAAQDLIESSHLPTPFLIGRFSQINSRTRAAATGTAAALQAADAAGALADAAEARRRIVALDLAGYETSSGQRPAAYALLTHRFGVSEEQVAALVRDSAPLGQSAASLLLGMAVRVPVRAQRAGSPSEPAAAVPDVRPIRPLTLAQAIERRVPLGPLNVSLRILGLDVARENGAGSMP